MRRRCGMLLRFKCTIVFLITLPEATLVRRLPLSSRPDTMQRDAVS
jgi:hypothetical protein